MCDFVSSWTDYLVDDGTECNSTSDLLLEHNREQSLVDLLVPSLVLLINLLQKLQVCCILLFLFKTKIFFYSRIALIFNI